MYFLVNTSSAITANNCHGYYNRASNTLWLYNQAATGFLGPLTPGGAGTLDNGQCSISGAGSSVVSGPGTDLVLNLAMSKLGAYASAGQRVYLWVKDNEDRETGWVQTGTWGTVVSNTPIAYGDPTNSATLNQTFYFTGRDLDGKGDIQNIYFLINRTATISANNCHGYYNRASNSIWLWNDAGTAFLGPLTLGSAGTLANSQCSISGPGSSVPNAGSTDLMIILNMTRLGTYAITTQNVYVWVKDNEAHETGWVQTGTWGSIPANAPVVVSGTPVSSTSANQLFTFTGRDLDGYLDIENIYFLINTSATITANNCHGYYNRSTNKLWLYNDAATGFLGPLTPGNNAVLENSQCSITGLNSSIVAGPGTDLVLNLAMVLKGAYTTGTQKVYLWVKDYERMETGWIQTGTWSAH